jgi:membrane-bound lytic murein transglycosylase D
MKRIITILYALVFLLPTSKAGEMYMTQQEQAPLNDTTAEDEKKENALIDEVIKTKAVPAQDKVQYFSQVTKYGFKNLFSKYSYNSSLAYSAQVNPSATTFIGDYMKSHGNYLTKMKGWGLPYFNLIEGILTQYGLPKELKYIAVIESNLSTGATSYKGAGGPWQFMPYTARNYGLVVSGYYDERRDYYKSTHAASKYLLSLYKEFHDWLLVMAAYNGGSGRVISAIKKSGSRNFWDLQYYLPEESRTYVKRFIATHYIMEGGGGVTTISNSNNGMMINPAGGANPYDTKSQLTAAELETAATQSISGKYNSLIIAKNLAMDIIQFNHFNPDFDNMIANNGNYELRLPEDKMQFFLVNKYNILNECVQVLLGDNSISSNQTFYPEVKTKTTKKKKGK